MVLDCHGYRSGYRDRNMGTHGQWADPKFDASTPRSLTSEMGSPWFTYVIRMNIRLNQASGNINIINLQAKRWSQYVPMYLQLASSTGPAQTFGLVPEAIRVTPKEDTDRAKRMGFTHMEPVAGCAISLSKALVFPKIPELCWELSGNLINARHDAIRLEVEHVRGKITGRDTNSNMGSSNV